MKSILPTLSSDQDPLLIPLTSVFVIIDDLVKATILPQTKGRKPTLTLSECCSIALLRQYYGIKDWWHTYLLICIHYKQEYPTLGTYKSFVSCMNGNALWIYCINQILMKIAQQAATGAFAIDGSAIPVCKNHRIYGHKTMKNLSSRFKGSMGYWYGLKLHICASEDGKILLLSLTTAKGSERKFLRQVIESIRGIFIADAGYISKELEKLAASLGSVLFTCMRKNMKKIATHWQISYLNKRVKIESIFSVLKERMGLETPLPRSIQGWIAHINYVIFVYQFNKLLPFTIS